MGSPNMFLLFCLVADNFSFLFTGNQQLSLAKKILYYLRQNLDFEPD
jgi:hypothetical protein